MIRILYFGYFLWRIHSAWSYSNEIVKELNDHFSVEEPQLRTLSSLLRRMKEVAHGRLDPEKSFDVCIVSSFLCENLGESSDTRVHQRGPTRDQAGIGPTFIRRQLLYFLFGFLGDILLSEKQAVTILMNLEGARNYRSLSNDPEAIWAAMPIRYRFDKSLGKIYLLVG